MNHMFVMVNTVSPRLSGHHAALFLGSLSVMREAIGLAGGYETERIFGRLGSIRGPGEAPTRRTGGAAPRGRSEPTPIEELALAGQFLLRNSQSTGPPSAAVLEADVRLGDVALQALV